MPQILCHGLGFLKDTVTALQKSLSGIVKYQLFAVSVKKLRSELFLKRENVLGNGRLRGVHQLRSS